MTSSPTDRKVQLTNARARLYSPVAWPMNFQPRHLACLAAAEILKRRFFRRSGS